MAVDVSACPNTSICNAVFQGTENVGLAFGLTVAAGLSTTIGAALPLLPCVDETKTQYLSAGLAVSSGVMLYISFAEILPESSDYFCCVTGGDFPARYHGLGVLCFFLGALGTWGLHMVSHSVAAAGKRTAEMVRSWAGSRPRDGQTVLVQRLSSVAVPGTDPRPSEGAGVSIEMAGRAADTKEGTAPSNPLPSNSPLIGELELQAALPPSLEAPCRGTGVVSGTGQAKVMGSATADRSSARVAAPLTLANYSHGHGHGSEEEAPLASNMDAVDSDFAQVTDKARLKQMGMLTGAAIFVHNFPEGMVTFIGALSSPRLGYTLALAVALHNIPEGIAAAAPIYYATGNRRQAFWWGFLSGVSEPIGAFFGWLALRSLFSPAAFGAIFGLVAGMMVYIVVREALPTAHRYDPKDKLTTASVFGGMAVMAVSLLLFDL